MEISTPPSAPRTSLNVGMIGAHGGWPKSSPLRRAQGANLRLNGWDVRPELWRSSCSNTESTIHQLSPYIGKLKSTISRNLIEQFSRPGETVCDPFAGAGTVGVEAALLGRNVFLSDVNPYAYLLCGAKLSAPPDVSEAIRSAEKLLAAAAKRPRKDLRKVPRWVRRFFHPATLREILSFIEVARERNASFQLACLLGILHHQRPGFLSYPSSHLVPYLRTRRFPRRSNPSMYSYRPLRPRLMAKIVRTYKRFGGFGSGVRATVEMIDIRQVRFPKPVDCIITSPPYMNELDYWRDNRLRLWFLAPDDPRIESGDRSLDLESFLEMLKAFAEKAEVSLKQGGWCIVVVGEKVERSYAAHPAELAVRVFGAHAPKLLLHRSVDDRIPDIRRARRDLRGTKRERILVFQRT